MNFSDIVTEIFKAGAKELLKEFASSSSTKFGCNGYSADKVFSRIITGHSWNDDLKEALSKIVDDYIDNYRYVKVGITNRPCERFREHNYDNNNGYGTSADKGLSWDKMVIIYKSSSINNTRNIEKYFTDEYKNRHKLHNQTSGGGGGSGSGTQYVYVLLK